MLEKNKEKEKRKNRKTFVGFYSRKTKTKAEKLRIQQNKETKKQIKESLT